MTKGLEELLNLRELETILKDDGVIEKKKYQPDPSDDAEGYHDPDMERGMKLASQTLAMIDGKDHSEAMDKLHDETLDHARSIVDLGFNIDHARAPRMFEVAAGFYKMALDAKNSKRDAQLKAMQLVINQQKLELEKRAAGLSDNSTIEAKGSVIKADRNELIKQLREQQKQEQAKGDE